MADISLNISTEKYQSRITTLQGYISQLENLKGSYQQKMREIPSIWQDSEAEEYYRAVNLGIEKVQKAIEAANSNITQLTNIINNLSTTSSNISASVTEAANVAERLFE